MEYSVIALVVIGQLTLEVLLVLGAGHQLHRAAGRRPRSARRVLPLAAYYLVSVAALVVTTLWGWLGLLLGARWSPFVAFGVLVLVVLLAHLAAAGPLVRDRQRRDLDRQARRARAQVLADVHAHPSAGAVRTAVSTRESDRNDA